MSDGEAHSPDTDTDVEDGGHDGRVLAPPPSIPPPATTSTVPSALTDGLPEDRYLNRELSWLDFNSRVLALAEDVTP